MAGTRPIDWESDKDEHDDDEGSRTARMGPARRASGGARLKRRWTGFVNEITAFQAEIKSNLQQQEERLTMLDRKLPITTATAPALSTGDAARGLHLKAFDAYLRSGDDDGLRGLVLEGKA
jgi:hypothetical protein